MSEDAEPHDDAERLEDAEHVLHGPDGSGAWRQLLYVVYVVALLSGVYGFTVARGVVLTYGPAWREQGLLVPVGLAGAGVALALLALAVPAGRRRGPVAPAGGWVDLVVASSIDRWATLRESWLLPLTTLGAGGAVVGGVLGAALWAGGLTGAPAAPAGLLAGAALGVLGTSLWLAGQLRADPAFARAPSTASALVLALRPASALRALGLDGLRTQGARSDRLGGALLAGDARALRLETASPVRRGRTVRLRSRGRLPTLVARDALGLRRQPLLLLLGPVTVLGGALAVAAFLGRGPVPVLVAVLGVLGCHLGAGLWGEGLRLHGDTLGAPRLLGGSVRSGALAHSVLPALLLLGVAGPTVVVQELVSGGPVAAGILTVLVLTVVSTAAQWVRAFRVLPPTSAMVPGSGPQVLLAWMAWPFLLAGLAGSAAVVSLDRLASGSTSPAPLLVCVGVLALVPTLASRALDRAATAHRD